MQRPHASRPRGPPNWLQDGGREGGRGRGGGDPAAAATPPAVPAPAGAGQSRSDLGCGGSELCASPGGHAAGFCSPGGCPYASSERDFRAENSQDSDTSKGRELARRYRLNRSPLWAIGRLCPRHLWSPTSTVARCTCPTLAEVSARSGAPPLRPESGHCAAITRRCLGLGFSSQTSALHPVPARTAGVPL